MGLVQHRIDRGCARSIHAVRRDTMTCDQLKEGDVTDEQLEDERLKFLIEDYRQKVQYLKDHLTRIWTRFNFFLTLQTAIFGTTIISTEKYQWRVPAFGIFISALWYFVGAQDRYLVELYRKQIQNAVLKIKHGLQLSEYYYIGQTEDIPGEVENVKDLRVKNTYYQWRSEQASTTRLAAIIPLIMLIIWTVVCLVTILSSWLNKSGLTSQ